MKEITIHQMKKLNPFDFHCEPDCPECKSEQMKPMEGEEMKLNLGCGYDKKKGYINIDKMGNPDLIHDLNDIPLPYDSGNFSEILMLDILEHLDNPMEILFECHRLISKDGVIKIRLPHFSCFNAYDPLHKTYWYASYFKRFTEITDKGSYEQYKLFHIKKMKIHFYKGKLLWNYPIEFFVNINDSTRLLYESLFAWIFPANWIEVELCKK